MWLALHFFGQYISVYCIYLPVYFSCSSLVPWNQIVQNCLLSPFPSVFLLYSLSQWIALFMLPQPGILESFLIPPFPMFLISISCKIFLFLSAKYLFHVLLSIAIVITWVSLFFNGFLIFVTFRSLLLNNIKNRILPYYSTTMVSFLKCKIFASSEFFILN